MAPINSPQVAEIEAYLLRTREEFLLPGGVSTRDLCTRMLVARRRWLRLPKMLSNRRTLGKHQRFMRRYMVAYEEMMACWETLRPLIGDRFAP